MEILNELINVLLALWGLVVALGAFLLPWLPLIAWVAFWMLAVNWRKLYPVLSGGGYIGLALIAIMAILVWGVVGRPEDGHHYLLGLTVGNFIGKTVYVAGLVVIMFLCATVQLSGAVDCCTTFDDEEPAVASDHQGEHVAVVHH